uniref:Uncharacterized protein n=1 Tax=Arundo donax TaxID=35708 RepID=A0A0A9GGY2_ARUDO
MEAMSLGDLQCQNSGLQGQILQ